MEETYSCVAIFFYTFRNPLPSDFFVVRRTRDFGSNFIRKKQWGNRYDQGNLCSLNLRAQTIPKKSERDLWRKHTCVQPSFFFALSNSFLALKSCFLWSEKEDPNSKQCSLRDSKVATRTSMRFLYLGTILTPRKLHERSAWGLSLLVRNPEVLILFKTSH